MIFRRLVLAAALVVSAPALASAAPGVLVLFSVDRMIPIYVELEEALRTALGLPSANLDYFAEFLDATRFVDQDLDRAWSDFLARKYAGRDIRVVITVASEARDFWIKHREALLPNAPVIVVADRMETTGAPAMPRDFIVIPMAFEVSGTVEMARRLQPRATEVVTAVGSSPADQQWEDLVRRDLPSASAGLTIRILKGLSYDGIIREMATLTPASIVLSMPIGRDAEGQTRIPIEVHKQIVAASGAPVYSVFGLTIGTGSVGGKVVTYASVGSRAAEVARRLLDGERPASIPTLDHAPSMDVVDWRAMERWGFDQARLPPGTEVRFKSPTIFAQYKWLILGVCAVIVLQAISLARLLISQRRRDAAEARAHALRNDVSHLARVSLMGELTASLAHEVNQPLTAILANAQAAQRFLEGPAPDLGTVRDILSDVVADDRRATDVIERIRALVKRGVPQSQPLQCGDVVADVLRFARRDLSSRDVFVTAEAAAGLPDVAGDRVQLQQVVLNLIMNAADAIKDLPRDERRILVHVSSPNHAAVDVTVSDRGPGIAADQLVAIFEPFVTTKANGLGMGLSVSRTIVEAHGGRLWATNNPDQGATLHMALPAMSVSSGSRDEK